MTCQHCLDLATSVMEKAEAPRYTKYAVEWARKVFEEAVLGGTACHWPERHMPKTTTKGEQR